MVNVATVAKYLSRLALMKFFPSDPDARTALVEMVCGMIESEEQADWLAKRMLQIYREWPGPHEMRACFCCRYKPADGINAYSQVYPDCMPADPTVSMKRLGAPEMLALPAGHSVSGDRTLDHAMRLVRTVQDHKNVSIKGKATPAEIAAAPDWLRRLEGYES